MSNLFLFFFYFTLSDATSFLFVLKSDQCFWYFFNFFFCIFFYKKIKNNLMQFNKI